MLNMLKNETAKKIDDYIEAHSDCEIKKIEPYEINGKREDLQVFRLPIELLIYNIRNGRFAAQLKEKEAILTRHLNPEEPEDAIEIEKLLLIDEKQTEYLKQGLTRVGQLRPGVITHDGQIINGNRRVAILRQLLNETHENKYGYFETVRLPTVISKKDLWRIEAGIQLSVDLQVSYGPINELLKIKEGKEAGLQIREIALVLGGDNDKDSITVKLNRLALIENYLKYIGEPNVYSIAERHVEHFIDLQNVMDTNKWEEIKPEKKVVIIHSIFEAIRSGVPHLKIRELRKIISEESTLNEFICSMNTVCGIETYAPEQNDTDKKDDSKREEEEIEEMLTEQKPKNKQTVKTETEKKSTDDKEVKEKIIDAIDDAVDKVEAKRKSTKPARLVKKAENIINTICEIDSEKLKPLKSNLNNIAISLKKVISRL